MGGDRDRVFSVVRGAGHEDGVFVTKNSAYCVLDGVCVGVKDRATGEWKLKHPAVGREVAGSMRYLAGGHAAPSLALPGVGDALVFVVARREVITTRVERVEPPSIASA